MHLRAATTCACSVHARTGASRSLHPERTRDRLDLGLPQHTTAFLVRQPICWQHGVAREHAVARLDPRGTGSVRERALRPAIPSQPKVDRAPCCHVPACHVGLSLPSIIRHIKAEVLKELSNEAPHVIATRPVVDHTRAQAEAARNTQQSAKPGQPAPTSNPRQATSGGD